MNHAARVIATAQENVRTFRAFVAENPGIERFAEDYRKITLRGIFIELSENVGDLLGRYSSLKNAAEAASHTLRLYDREV